MAGWKPRQKPRGWRSHASTVDYAWELATRKLALGMEPTRVEWQRVPAYLRPVLDDCRPERSRHRSSRMDTRQKTPRVVTMHPPSRVVGFSVVMGAVARHAGCSVGAL